jgi:hypothetical protein
VLRPAFGGVAPRKTGVEQSHAELVFFDARASPAIGSSRRRAAVERSGKGSNRLSGC